MSIKVSLPIATSQAFPAGSENFSGLSAGSGKHFECISNTQATMTTPCLGDLIWVQHIIRFVEIRHWLHYIQWYTLRFNAEVGHNAVKLIFILMESDSILHLILTPGDVNTFEVGVSNNRNPL